MNLFQKDEKVLFVSNIKTILVQDFPCKSIYLPVTVIVLYTSRVFTVFFITIYGLVVVM